MSLIDSSKERKALDRLIVERELAQRIAEDLPAFYKRLAGIVMDGEDGDSIKAALALMDRLLGKAKDSDERPKQAFVVNIVNPSASDPSRYKITRYGANLGEEGAPVVVEADFEASPPTPTPTPTPTPEPPEPDYPSLPPSSNIEFDLYSVKTPPTPHKSDV